MTTSYSTQYRPWLRRSIKKNRNLFTYLSAYETWATNPCVVMVLLIQLLHTQCYPKVRSSINIWWISQCVLKKLTILRLQLFLAKFLQWIDLFWISPCNSLASYMNFLQYLTSLSFGFTYMKNVIINIIYFIGFLGRLNDVMKSSYYSIRS